MKVSREASAANRDRVVKTASRLFRERGIDGIGVADIMREAGLTHGGFYRHFPSKDALVTEACAHALQGERRPADGCTTSVPPSVVARIERYLSLSHRDHPGHGCAVPALAADVATSNRNVQDAFTNGIEDLLADFIDELREVGVGPAQARSRALVALATMSGAVAMARAVSASSPKLSEDVLKTARETLLEWLQ